MYVFITIFVLKIASCNCVLPQYSPANQEQELARNEAIVNYFRLGFTAPEILAFLVTLHGVQLSLRQLRRILRSHGCRRRVNPTDINEVAQVIEEQLKGSGRILGYRAMHQRLINDHNLVVVRNTVRRVLKILDPEGVEARSRHLVAPTKVSNERAKLFMAHRWLR